MNLSGPPRPRPKLDPVSSSSDSLSSEEVCKRFKDIQEKSGQLNIGGQLFAVEFKDLERVEKDGQLGDGASGSVCKYRFKSRPIAVKQMRRTDSVDESKRIFMDLDVISRCRDCRYIVNYYGYIFTFDYVYICMELMCTCLEKLLNRRRADPSRHPDAVGLPEEIIGRIALSVVRALDYLKETHKIMHRDVKPSNILLDWFGNVKLCDFGISGKLIESKAITKTGCTGYLAPERVNIDGSACTYDVRADVWSLGITLIQLATGCFPYEPIHNTIELMLAIRNTDPPRLDPGPDGRFSAEFCQFIADCLQKDMTVRPKFRDLLDKPFLQRAAMAEQNGTVDVALWCASQQQGDSESEDAQMARAEYEAKYGRS